MLIGRDEITRLVPHGERMCMIDQVTSWNEGEIVATTSSHSREDNPLVEGGRMDAVVLVEYGAQTAAIHSALLKSGFGSRRPAYLGSIRKLYLFTEDIDVDVGELNIRAQRIFTAINGVIYDIAVCAEENELVSGRIVLIQPS